MPVSQDERVGFGILGNMETDRKVGVLYMFIVAL